MHCQTPLLQLPVLFHLRNSYVTLTLVSILSYFHLLSLDIVAIFVLFDSVCFYVTVIVFCCLCQINQSVNQIMKFDAVFLLYCSIKATP